MPIRAALLLIVSLAALALACAPDGGSRPARSTLVVGTAVDMAGVNQLMGAHGRFGQDVIDLLFLHLFSEQPDWHDHPPTFAPRLADRWSWSDGGLTLSIRLRDDVVWSDGRPVTSADVAWTLEAQTDPDVAWAYAHSKDRIEAIRVIDEHTLEVRFSEVYAARLADLNVGVILPSHAWSRLPFADWRGNSDWFLRNLVVSGPYDLDSWHPQEEIVLARNPSFYRPGRPRIDRVVFRVIPQPEARLRQLAAGHIDFIEQVRPSDLATLRASPHARPLSTWHRQYGFIAWNGCRSPFSDPIVRLAMTHAIDRQGLVDALWPQAARVAITPIPLSTWAADRELEPWPYDPERSRRLLESRGWADSDGDGVLDRDGEPLRFELSTNGDNGLRMDAAEIIRRQLAAVGAEARPVGLEFNALVSSNLSGEYDATIGAWGVDTSLDLGYAFHSDAISTGYNYGCYRNPRVDRLIDEARRQSSVDAARPMLIELQRILHADQPYTFLWEPQRLDGASRRVRGAFPTALGAFTELEDWWLASPS